MISTITYSGDGVTRVFPVSFEIKGEAYVVTYINNVAVADKTKYDIINNSIVFVEGEAPVIGTDNVQIVVASTPTEIADLNAPPSSVQTVLDNLTAITTVAGNITNINYLVSESATLNSLATDVLPNITEILEADTNALIAQNAAIIAETKADEAVDSALAAHNSELQAQEYALQVDPSKIVSKDSPTGAAYIPSGTTLERPLAPVSGYLRYNTDLVSMEAYSNGAWGSVGGGATGGGQDRVFNLNDQIVTTNYTIPVGQNAVSAGDITIASGVTVTITSGSKWSIV